MNDRQPRRFLLLGALATVVSLALAGSGAARPNDSTGSANAVSADGSSTVGPYVTAAAERFGRSNRSAQVTVGISGTGGGFERFCKGEIDLANASRPIRQTEAAICRQNGVQYTPFLVANDGIAIVVNRENTWATCLTTDELKKIWDTGSRVSDWSEVRAGFPNVPLKLFGPGTDSGTFDFFTEKINGRSRRSRSDYSATENDNVAVRGVTGERGGLAYFGLSYFEENASQLKLVAVNSGSGCVTPSIKTVQAFQYKPLSRPLFVYAKRESFKRPVVQAFIRYMIQNEKTIANAARFVSLTDRQLRKSRFQYNSALSVARRG
ncbi:PstS family phosphate ABC transporter substrate-binding protein [soil metagenome]